VGATNGAVQTADIASAGALSPERLHRRYAPRIRRHVLAVLGSDAEYDDVVQDVLVVVLSKVNTVRNLTCLDWWVAQVTANTMKQLIRRRRLRRHASLEDVTEALLPTMSTDFEARELATRALEVLLSLPPNDRALLTTYWLSQTTIEGIAAQFGCSIITVRRKLSRARARFDRVARRDPALAGPMNGARFGSELRDSAPTTLVPPAMSEAPEHPSARALVA
jgi:RNA polymerase sigma-70 factor (ECF subfamily)